MTNTNKKSMTPEEYLAWLCDISVKDCVAHVSEMAPGADFDEPEVVDTLIKQLQQTLDLTGVLLDGFAGIRRPGILNDGLVFYNRTEEEMLAHLANPEIPRHEHVHWMFNELMRMLDERLGKFRAALPHLKEEDVKYVIDVPGFRATVERMLRVVVQSAEVKVLASKKSLQKCKDELQKKLDGFDKMNDSDLQEKLRELENKRKKFVEARGKSGLKAIDKNIAQVKADIELVASRDKLEIQVKSYKAAKNAERLAAAEAELIATKSAINIKEQGLKKALIAMTAEREMFAGVAGKQKKRDALDAEIEKCHKQIEAIKAKIFQLEDQMEELEAEFRNGREPETSPIYQRRVDDHVKQMYARFYALGEKHKIQIVTKPEILVFGTCAIDYDNDRGRTDHPMPVQAKRLAEFFHGRMKQYRKKTRKLLQERNSPVTEVDVIMQGGNSGKFFARWQKQHLTAEEIRMQHINTYETGGSNGVKHMLFLSGMPFEAQHKIGLYAKRQKPSRTRAGKMMGTANHPAFIRYYQGSVSGVTIIRKHNHGFMSVEPIMYELFLNKEVLEPFKGVMSQEDSDNHLGSPEMDLALTLGTFALLMQLMKNPLELYGQKVYVGGTMNLGDIAEANSKAWKEAIKFMRQQIQAIREIAGRLTAMDMTNYESVFETARVWANDMMGGANENMKLIMRLVADFLKEKFLTVYRHSPTRLLDILAVLQGNHFANAVRDVGIEEYTVFEDWLLAWKNLHKDFPELGLKPFPLKILTGGEPQYHQPDEVKPEMVVHLGGYGPGRQGIIEEYGKGHDGKLHVRETYRVFLTHEPNAFDNKAANADADVGKGGHRHESYLEAVNTGENTARFIDQKPCTQRVSATELGYGGLPRTAGIDLCVWSQPQRYMKMTIPAEHMRLIGEAQRMVDTKAAVENKLAAAKKK